MSSTSTSSPYPSEDANATAAANFITFTDLLGIWQQEKNEDTGKYYGVAVGGAIVLFAAIYWTRFLFREYARRDLNEAKIVKSFVSVSRLIRRYNNRPVPLFKSLGHALLVALYLVVNVILTVTNQIWVRNNVVPIGNRLGWMATLNLAFITFLALKNTPLAFVVAQSYESLNHLHQVGGYVTFTFGALHATMESYAWVRRPDRPGFLLWRPQISGMVVLISFFVMAVTGLTVRKLKYELFYTLHILLFMLVIINLGLHRPDFTLKTIIITLFTASMWFLDKSFRILRILWRSFKTKATIYPLSQGGTRVVLHGPLSWATRPGKHCFLWIPKIRVIETHPFTIVKINSSPPSLDLVIAACDGFTNALHEYAVKNPGTCLRASVGGPYGVLPFSGKAADKMVLIAGGSGASFTFGIALDVLKKHPSQTSNTRTPSINFAWTVRDKENLSWFHEELEELHRSPRVLLSLHATRTSPAASAISKSLYSNTDIGIQKRAAPDTLSKTGQTYHSLDVEKAGVSSASTLTSITISCKRLDIDAYIKDVWRGSKKDDRIVVVACGPGRLMRAVKETTARCITVGGPSVELHCEEFGW